MATRIKVRLKNGREVLFPYYVLDHVIKKKEIVAFERSDGWVLVDRDPVRSSHSGPFAGDKKRASDLHPPNGLALRALD